MKIKEEMQALTQGVYIVGTKMGDDVNGMTAAWVTQVSSSPKTILLAVGKTHYTAELIKENGSFSLSVLEESQKSIARACGYVSGRTEKKLRKVDYTLSKAGNPLITGAVAHIDLKVAEIIEIGDHVLFTGEVVESAVFTGTPMRYEEAVFF